MAKKKIILDTNFLLIPGQFNVDIFTEVERILGEPFELCIVDKSIAELNRLVAVGKEKDRFAAKLALVLVIQKNLMIAENGSKRLFFLDRWLQMEVFLLNLNVQSHIPIRFLILMP